VESPPRVLLPRLREHPSDRVSETYQGRYRLLPKGSLPQSSQRAGHPDLPFFYSDSVLLESSLCTFEVQSFGKVVVKV